MSTKRGMQAELLKEVNSVNEGKKIAIISYITVVGLVVAFVLNNEKRNEFGNFHLRQSLGLLLSGLVLSVGNVIPFLGWTASAIGFFFLFVLWVQGLLAALNGKKKTVFLLGPYFQEWFRGI